MRSSFSLFGTRGEILLAGIVTVSPVRRSHVHLYAFAKGSKQATPKHDFLGGYLDREESVHGLDVNGKK